MRVPEATGDRCLGLRKAGLTYEQIATSLHISDRVARDLVQSVLKAYSKEDDASS